MSRLLDRKIPLFGVSVKAAVTAFLAMGFGLLVYKYAVTPFLPQLVDLYGPDVSIVVRVVFVVSIIVYGLIVIADIDRGKPGVSKKGVLKREK